MPRMMDFVQHRSDSTFIDCGADCKLLQDGHTFDRRESVREIARILQDLIDLCNS